MRSRNILLISLAVILVITVSVLVMVVNKPKSSGDDTSGNDGNISHDNVSKQIVSYLQQVYPLHSTNQWNKLSDKDLKDVYANLQVLYTPIIGQLWEQISERIPKRSTQATKSLTNPYKLSEVESGQPIINGPFSSIPGEYTQRLFDGSVCDCMRAWVPACVSASRFSASLNYEKDCPQWPGLATLTSLEYVEQLLSIGGYPKNSFVEVLTFPGEYGVPENCPLNNQPLSDIANQPLTFPNNPDYHLTGIPGTNPYFDSSVCGPNTNINVNYGDSCIQNFSKPEVKYCGFPKKDANGTITGWEGCDCVKAITNNGNTTGFCLDTEQLTQEFRDAYSKKQSQVAPPACTRGNCTQGTDYIGLVEDYQPRNSIYVPSDMFNTSKTKLQPDCNPSSCTTCDQKCSVTGPDADLLKQPCPCPDVIISPLFYYPLRGIGLWTNLSNAASCATKLGFVTTPREGITLTGLGGITIAGARLSGGGGYKLKDLFGLLIGNTKGSTGLKAQVSTVYAWLMAGYLSYDIISKSGCKCRLSQAYYGNGYPPGWEYVAKNRLNMDYNVKGQSDKCVEGAFELVTAWYQEGFIRHDNEPQGFNANIGEWWPCGAMFTYSSSMDMLVTGVIETHQYDSLQQICEPQHSQGSMRPAYVTEIIKAIQRKGPPVDWIHSKSTDRSGCETNFIINPKDDWDTWKTHGYVAGKKTLKENGGSGVLQFDHRIMSLTPSNPNKKAMIAKSW